MTAAEFNTFWQTRYPRTIPIGYRFKHDYHDRWVRVHSLPEMQRYPANEEDWGILLHRQNTIINDLIGNEASILLVTGEYKMEDFPELQPSETLQSLKLFSFTKAEEAIDLHSVSPGEYDKGHSYTPMFTDLIWQNTQFDNVLRDIALDKLRAFFVSITNKCIVSPYDGGIDVILKDSVARDFYKDKYKDWLSPRADGF